MAHLRPLEIFLGGCLMMMLSMFPWWKYFAPGMASSVGLGWIAGGMLWMFGGLALNEIRSES